MWEENDASRGRGTDVLEAFRQVHLTTGTERAIYRLFASDPDGCWSDAEMAFAARVDLDQVRWGVQRFTDAGIVEVVEDCCYRWRPELRYVFERVEPAADRTDPVCLMPVGDDATYRAEDVFGRTESFCSERCMTAFVLWPLLFTRPPDSEGDPGLEGAHAW